MKILESIVCVISQLIFWEQGSRSGKWRNVAESVAKRVGTISQQFCKFKISPTHATWH